MFVSFIQIEKLAFVNVFNSSRFLWLRNKYTDKRVSIGVEKKNIQTLFCWTFVDFHIEI